MADQADHKENQAPLRIAFMGTPDFSVPALQSLLNSHHNIVCVYTQPPRPKGRGKKLTPSAIHDLANSADIDVRTPINFKSHKDIHDFEKLELDIAIVAAYGLILPKEIVNAPRYGCVNIHASLLPRWRGAAPIHRALLEGDSETGITLMQMDEGLDTGDIIAMEKVMITPSMKLAELHDSLAELGSNMLQSFLNDLAAGKEISRRPQPEEGACYASMLKKSEGAIDWSQSSDQIERKVRAFNPWPGTWTHNSDGKRIKIIEANLSSEMSQSFPGTTLENGMIACGDNTVLELKTIQPENKNVMDVQAAMNGGYLNLGDILQ
ncbi:MAG: methionyl-tRNA formyltransferase [Pseudomonadota bacterium]